MHSRKSCRAAGLPSRGLIVVFWAAALADALSTRWAVEGYGGTLEHEINPFLKDGSWIRFAVFLFLLHVLLQIVFSAAWRRLDAMKPMVKDHDDLFSFSWRAFLRFLTVHVPDRCQLVYTAVTMYITVAVAHLVAVANNMAVALGGRGLLGGFLAAASRQAVTAGGADAGHAYVVAVLLFYAFAALAGIVAAHAYLLFAFHPAGPGEDFFSRLVALVPEKWYGRLGFVFFASCAVHKASVYGTYSDKLLWLMETGIFVALSIFCITRRAPKKGPRGAGQVLLPLVGGVWPFLMLMTPRGAFGLRYQRWILSFMCLSTALSLWGYISLNRAFAIMVEARELKTGGPYRWLRHPVYTGQILTAAAVLSWRWSAFNLAVFLGFVVIQVYRAVQEEKVLSQVFPEYGEYRRRAWAIMPRVFRRNGDCGSA